VFWGVDVEAASHLDDESFLTKSGTSFSTPMLSGLTGLLWETGRRAYGENWLFRWTEARELGPYYCIKPEDAPVQKGNTYGYGLPAVGTMVGRLASAAPALDVESMMAPMIMMAMMIGMVKMV
jgi:serine protease AprX